MPVSKVYDHTNYRELLAHKSVILPDRTIVGAHVAEFVNQTMFIRVHGRDHDD